MWNQLIMVIKFDKVGLDEKNKARMLLSQLNTAGGSMIKKEIQIFLDDIVEKYGPIPTKTSLEQELTETIAEMEEFKLYWANRPKSRYDVVMVSHRLQEYVNTIDALRKKINNY